VAGTTSRLVRIPALPPDDADLPRARALFDPSSAAVVLDRFLRPRGWELAEVRPVQSIYRPSRSCTVRYRAQALGPDGPRWLSLCATTRLRPLDPLPFPQDFGTRFRLADPIETWDDVTVWAYPYDPMLAGLPDAAHAPTVRAASGMDSTAFSATPLRYRPLQRAVFRYLVLSGGDPRRVLFAKVLRDDAFERTFQAHRNLRRVRIPQSAPRAVTDLENLVLFEPMRGRDLRSLLKDASRLPSPGRVSDLIGRVAGAGWSGEAKARRPGRSVRNAATLLTQVLPDRRAEIAGLAAELAGRAEGTVAGLTIHGDLYEAQIFVDERHRLGLIDLEDAGPGDPLLDAANLLSHLATLSVSDPRAQGRPLAYRALLRRALLDAFGTSEAELAWRESLSMLLLATGPFRVLSPDWPRKVAARVDAAARLLDRSARAA
jgi:Phosphotransferase enzyme family